jgi:hypothetical protein
MSAEIYPQEFRVIFEPKENDNTQAWYSYLLAMELIIRFFAMAMAVDNVDDVKIEVFKRFFFDGRRSYYEWHFISFNPDFFVSEAAEMLKESLQILREHEPKGSILIDENIANYRWKKPRRSHQINPMNWILNYACN